MTTNYISTQIVGLHLPFTQPTRKFPGESNYNIDFDASKLFFETEVEYRTSNLYDQFVIAATNSEETSGESDIILDLFIPKIFFTIGALGFGQWNVSKDPNHCSIYSTLLKIFLYLAYQSLKVDPKHTTLIIQLGIAANTDLNNPIQNVTGYWFRLSKRSRLGLGTFDSMLYEYLEANRKYEEKMMAMKSIILAREDELDEETGEPKNKKRSKIYHNQNAARKSHPDPFSILTLERWHQLIASGLGVNITKDLPEEEYDYLRGFNLNDHYIRPEIVFHLSSAMKIARSCVSPKTHPLFIDSENWVIRHPVTDEIFSRKFPFDGKFAWKVDITEFNYATFMNFQFPQIESSITNKFKPGYETYIRLHDIGNLAPECNYLDRRTGRRDNRLQNCLIKNKQALELNFERNFEKYPIDTPAYDETTLTKVQENRYIEVLNKLHSEDEYKYNLTPEQQRNKERVKHIEAQIEGVYEADAHLLTDISNVSPAMRAINTWWMNFTDPKIHHNACLTRKHFNMNLSSVADYLAGVQVGLEFHNDTYALHNRAMMLWLCIPEMYLGRKELHCHGITLGEPKTSKSYILMCIKSFLIPGSYFTPGYVTGKAFTAEGEDDTAINKDKFWDKLILIFEEIAAMLLGIKDGSAEAAITQAEDTMKLLLERGELSTARGSIQNGGVKTAVRVITARIIVLAAGNHIESSISQAIHSRASVLTVLNITRENHPGLVSTTGRSHDLNEKREKNKFLIRQQHMQAGVAILGQLISTGILLGQQSSSEMIDMTATSIVISLVVKYGGDYGLSNLNDIRHIIRVRKLVQSLVLIKAVELTFNNELSPLRGHSYKPHHFLLCEKYLLADVETTCIALGLLSHQFEDNSVYIAIHSLIKFIQLKNQMSTIMTTATENTTTTTGRRRRQVLEEYADQPRISNYTVHQPTEQEIINDPDIVHYECCDNWQTATTTNTQPNNNNNRRFNSYSPNLIDILSHYIISEVKDLSPRPRLDQLKKSLNHLLEVQLWVENSFNPQDRKRLNVFIIEDKRIKILKNANNLLNRDHTGLKQCLKYVLNYKHAKKRDILYGGQHPQAVYAFDVISIEDEPLPGIPREFQRKALTVHNPNHFQKEIIDQIYAMNDGFNLNNTEDLKKIASKYTNVQEHDEVLFDCDIDEYCTNKYNENCNFSKRYIDLGPSNNPFLLQQQIMNCSTYDPKGKIPYPDNLILSEKEHLQKHVSKTTSKILEEIKEKHGNPISLLPDLIEPEGQPHIHDIDPQIEEENKRRLKADHLPFTKEMWIKFNDETNEEKTCFDKDEVAAEEVADEDEEPEVEEEPRSLIPRQFRLLADEPVAADEEM